MVWDQSLLVLQALEDLVLDFLVELALEPLVVEVEVHPHMPQEEMGQELKELDLMEH